MIDHHRPVAEVYGAKIAVKAPSCLPVWQLEEFVKMESLAISLDSKWWCCSLLQFKVMPQCVYDISLYHANAISSFAALWNSSFQDMKNDGVWNVWFAQSRWNIPRFVRRTSVVSKDAWLPSQLDFRLQCTPHKGLRYVPLKTSQKHVEKAIILSRKRGWCIDPPHLKGRSSQTLHSLIKLGVNSIWIFTVRGGYIPSIPKLSTATPAIKTGKVFANKNQLRVSDLQMSVFIHIASNNLFSLWKTFCICIAILKCMEDWIGYLPRGKTHAGIEIWAYSMYLGMPIYIQRCRKPGFSTTGVSELSRRIIPL